jgi:hypothetical protein
MRHAANAPIVKWLLLKRHPEWNENEVSEPVNCFVRRNGFLKELIHPMSCQTTSDGNRSWSDVLLKKPSRANGDDSHPEQDSGHLVGPAWMRIDSAVTRRCERERVARS